MPSYRFGTGVLKATPEVGTEAIFGTLQDVTIDISFSKKELYGEHQFPVDIVRTSAKVNIKAKWALINAQQFNDIFLQGAAVTVGNTTTIEMTNQLMGSTPYFQLEFVNIRDGKPFKFVFPKCSCSKLALNFKNEDFTIPDIDIDAIADETGRVGAWVIEE